mmetsp:Transcript_11658/g.35576  ORF Transcript_11658/g.35576 Transcript_11658/m.35576 type:complete len:370 (+) Transcript_11658:164-1273(+)|eukprot:CAMPEP_0198732552 /NCGR_PEP_ID=MMETSP1475-20131203/36523_1 /TAXON_ID= ORGANISM="Unidentified sp., Strain CCMP1999" /NCGR_SAMPLE_ID=MMETSP1475 /ASSEMBLY_ACC=CAM_ASM_001111 /LENGTH=369 /DNA_ID=CAMNT_0044495689 /DNA_START=126 /DNA_END=1235 /DNA_ORIENTATION=+
MAQGGRGTSTFVLDEERGAENNERSNATEPNIQPVAEGTVSEPSGIMAFMKYMPSPTLLMCAFGIVSSLLVYAFLQEKIMTKPYGTPEEGEGLESYMFKNTLFLVLNNRMAAAIVAGAVIIVKGDMTQLMNAAPIYKYFMISVSNVLATSCQYEALKWVTFPTQTLAKCAKMIPVMIWGTFIHRKTYGFRDYAVAVMVALGCTVFTVSGNITAKNKDASDSWYGLLLMCGYLGFDGFTSTFQEKLFSGYQMSIYNQMLYVNLCSGMMSLVFLTGQGQLFSSIGFAMKFPRLVMDATVLSFSAVTSQFAITYTIKNFGALVYATIMTIRQFLSVFVSNIVYGHAMNSLQWLGAVTVFGALFYKSWAKARS